MSDRTYKKQKVQTQDWRLKDETKSTREEKRVKVTTNLFPLKFPNPEKIHQYQMAITTSDKKELTSKSLRRSLVRDFSKIFDTILIGYDGASSLYSISQIRL